MQSFFKKLKGFCLILQELFKSPRHSKNRSWRFSKTPWRICKKVKENLPVCFDGLSKHISIYMWICVSTLHPLHLRYTFMQKWAIPSIKWKGEGLIKKRVILNSNCPEWHGTKREKEITWLRPIPYPPWWRQQLPYPSVPVHEQQRAVHEYELVPSVLPDNRNR